MPRRPLIAVSQPYVPAYRLPLFEAVKEKLWADGVEFVVAAGDPRGAQAARGDDARPGWRVDIRSRSIPVGSRRISWRGFPNGIHPDVVVSELEALNVLAWATWPRRRKLVLWGHGKPYVNDAGTVSNYLEWVLARHADAVMTYAEGGRRFLIDQGGVPADRVVAIGNSTDSTALREALISVGTARGIELEAIWPHAPRALFVGGLDASKRIDFLVDAAIEARSIEPRFSLVVVGQGELESDLRRAGDAIQHVKAARGKALAELGFVTQAMWMPGRIGLVAVDALALGLPVLTTPYAFHAPEAEFLRQGEVEVLPNSPREFAALALSIMSKDQQGSRSLRSDIPSIESVSSRFAEVVTSVL